MATAGTTTRPHDRHSRRRPFSSWVKRLAALRHHAVNGVPPPDRNSAAQNGPKPRRQWVSKNNPYPESALPLNTRRTPPTALSGRPSAVTSFADSNREGSVTSYEDSSAGFDGRIRSMRSAAPTVHTNAETVHSDTGHSKTNGGALSSRDGGGNSTFSSPHQSQESLTTTLTTLQSQAPSAMLPPNTGPPTILHGAGSPLQATHPTLASPPAHLPPHLVPHPHTYHAAIANNMLTDNASVLTLASSSKRRRRNSLDTDASVRALAPSSLFGNSRESLPLSVLSANVDAGSGIHPGHARPTVAGFASAERASVYSSSGVAPVVNSERNSYYAAKQGPDGGSIRSGLLGHGKTDSINGSITGLPTSPLASPREPKEASLHGRTSRRNSDWQDGPVDDEEENAEPADEQNGTEVREKAEKVTEKVSKCHGSKKAKEKGKK